MIMVFVGAALSAEVASGSELGKTIDSFISKGNLVPLDVVVNTIVSALKAAPTKTIIIDGYPRSVEQMMEFDRVLNEQNEVCLKGVIEVRVSEKVAKERVLGRNRGADDNEEVFNNRMKVYTEPLNEILDFYQKKKLHFIIRSTVPTQNPFFCYFLAYPYFYNAFKTNFVLLV